MQAGQEALFEEAGAGEGGQAGGAGARRRGVARRANELDGRTWERYSISIWSDIRKTAEELRLGHPAIFPVELVRRLIQCFTTRDDRVVLDPFAGTGSTVLAAASLGKTGIGIELSEAFCRLARSRPLVVPLGLGEAPVGDAGGRPGESAPDGDGAPPRASGPLPQPEPGQRIIHQGDARELLRYVARESVDLVVTSPPYWDILLQRRTADAGPTRHYGDAGQDLGKVGDYRQFLAELQGVFRQVFEALRPGKYCIVVVMDLRKKDRFYPFHADLAVALQGVGFLLDDIIIWDRRHEYNHLRPLGYPYRFRINKAHEYILIFLKPGAAPRPARHAWA